MPLTERARPEPGGITYHPNLKWLSCGGRFRPGRGMCAVLFIPLGGVTLYTGESNQSRRVVLDTHLSLTISLLRTPSLPTSLKHNVLLQLLAQKKQDRLSDVSAGSPIPYPATI